MGGRGTYSKGQSPAYQYAREGTIDGVKIIRPINPSRSRKLPEESHTANTSYVLFDKDGVFHQYREYVNHKIILEIGYHHENSLGQGDVLHVHIHTVPGVEGHKSAIRKKLLPTDPLYKQHSKLFIGVKI